MAVVVVPESPPALLPPYSLLRLHFESSSCDAAFPLLAECDLPMLLRGPAGRRHAYDESCRLSEEFPGPYEWSPAKRESVWQVPRPVRGLRAQTLLNRLRCSSISIGFVGKSEESESITTREYSFLTLRVSFVHVKAVVRRPAQDLLNRTSRHPGDKQNQFDPGFFALDFRANRK
jgi:hypothetical protein